MNRVKSNDSRKTNSHDFRQNSLVSEGLATLARTIPIPKLCRLSIPRADRAFVRSPYDPLLTTKIHGCVPLLPYLLCFPLVLFPLLLLPVTNRLLSSLFTLLWGCTITFDFIKAAIFHCPVPCFCPVPTLLPCFGHYLLT